MKGILFEIKSNDELYNCDLGDIIIVSWGQAFPIFVNDNSENNANNILGTVKHLCKRFNGLNQVFFDKSGNPQAYLYDNGGEKLSVKEIVKRISSISELPKTLFFYVDECEDGLMLSCHNETNYDVLNSKELNDFLKTDFANSVDCFEINGKTYKRDELLSMFYKRTKNNNENISKALYHGTCLAFLKDILNKGIRQVETNSVWQIHNKGLVFLTNSFNNATTYAELYSEKTETSPCVLEINTDLIDKDKLTLDYDFSNRFSSDHGKSNIFSHTDSDKYLGAVTSNEKRNGTKYIKVGYQGIIKPSAVNKIFININGGWKEYTKEQAVELFSTNKNEGLKMKNNNLNEQYFPKNFEQLPDTVKLYHGTTFDAINSIVESGYISAKEGRKRGETYGVNWFSLKNGENFGDGNIFSITVPKNEFKNGTFRFMNETEIVSQEDRLYIGDYNFFIEKICGVRTDAIAKKYNELGGDIWELQDITINWGSNDELQLVNPSYRYVITQFFGEDALKEYNDFMRQDESKRKKNKKKKPISKIGYVRQGLVPYGDGDSSFADFGMISEITSNDINLSSFPPKDSLNPKFWVGGKINSRVRIRLLDIANDFIDELSVRWVKPVDIVFTGSLANYNWSKYSDIDIHVIMDYSEIYDKKEFVEDYFKSKKEIWNQTHDELTIYGFHVELYVEDVDAPSRSSGVFSLKKNEWIKQPKDLSDATLNKDYIKEKSAEYINRVEDLEDKFESAKTEAEFSSLGKTAKRLFDKLKKTRKEALETKAGEMSSGNIIWKVLRRSGSLDTLYDIIDKTYDRAKSLD